MSRPEALALAGCLLALAAPASAAEYVVTADAMRTDGDAFVFSGAVAIDSTELKLAASELVVDGDVYRIAGAPALLTLYQGGVATRASGSKITYDSSRQLLELGEGGDVAQGELTVAATSISFDIPAQSLKASGAVRLRNADLSASGASAQSRGRDDALRMVLTGAPARLDISGEQGLSASAARIEINRRSRQVVLRGDAEAKVANQSVAGEVIEYDLERSAFSALPDQGGRVRAVITTR